MKPTTKHCIVCNGKFITTRPNKKICSDKCSIIHQREYGRNYYKTIIGRNNVLKAVKKYQSSHPEKMREKNRKHKIHYPSLIEYTEEQLNIFDVLASRQQFIEYFIEIGNCCICGEDGTNHKRVEHHISYVPEEKIIMCYPCHGILHNRYLKGRKCIPSKPRNIIC